MTPPTSATGIGAASRLRWLLFTRWGSYSEYLTTVERRLETTQMPGVGEVHLDETFVPLRLRPWSEDLATARFSDEADVPHTALPEALDAHAHLVLIGPTGIGKSALLRWHTLQRVREAQRIGRRALLLEGENPNLPIYVPLMDAPEDVDPIERAAATIEDAGFEDGGELLTALLRAGRATLLFDHLDARPVDVRRAIAGRIASRMREHPTNRVVVAVRDVADTAWLDGFEVFEVAGVDPSRVETLAGRWGYGHIADESGFLHVIERVPLVRSLVARPGWLAAGLANVAGRRIRAFDIVDGFVRHVDPEADRFWSRLACGMHRERRATGSAAQVPEDRRESGLLWWLSDDRFCFVHPAVQAYFAAAHATSQGSSGEVAMNLADKADDPWWEPVLLFSVGHLGDRGAVDLVEGLFRVGQPERAALALAEMHEAPSDLAERAQIALLEDLAQPEGPSDRASAVALAGLVGGETVGRGGVIAPVLAALERGAGEARAEAARALGRIGDPMAIAPLLTALGDPTARVRNAASDALATFGDRTLQPLVRQLNVPDERVRGAATRALAQQGANAVPALVSLLDSSSAIVRSEAADTLARIGAPAVPALARIVGGDTGYSDRDSTRLSAASDALTKIGGPAARALVGLYAEADPAHRERVVGILREMGSAAADALGAVARDPRHAHSAEAAGLLGLLPDVGATAARHLVSALADPRFEVQDEARRSLAFLKGMAGEALVDALGDEEPRVQWEAAQILLRLEDPPTEQLIPVLRRRLSTGDVAERRQAIESLAQLPANAVEGVVREATDDDDPLVRRAAIRALGSLDAAGTAGVLEQRWAVEDKPRVALTILEVLTAVDTERAIPILIEALTADDKELRATAVELMGDIGEPAVIPLIRAWSAQPCEIDRDGVLRVLERAGVGARSGGRSPANLARTFHRMIVEQLDIEELGYLATTIEWWPPALELHRTFSTARKFLEIDTLGGIAGAEEDLEWIDGHEDWLRPAAQKALRQVRLISQAVQYYNRASKRNAKEKGLLTATARINELHSMVGDLGEPHDRVFHDVAEHWRELINHAIREFQGRAEIGVEIRTDHVRIRDADTAAVLVFEVGNQGEGLASNVQLTLRAGDGDLELQSSPTHYLPPLGHGDRLSVEFTVQRQGAGVVPLDLEIKYDDPQGEGRTRQFTREVRFFVEEAEYKDIGTSPYIAGPPVKSREMFYGRQSTFQWIQENLSGTYQVNVLVLYGERRTGKTSVLYQLQYHLPDEYAFVLIDLQSIAYALNSTSDLLYAMARKAVGGLKRQGFEVERPNREDYADHPIEQFEQLGEDLGRQAMAMGRRAVLIADEFDLLIEAVEEDQVSPYVFDCIRGLMQHQEGLSFIFAGAHKVTEMLKNPQSILFNTALRRRVSYLETAEAERLIREPVSDVLWYDDLAVEKILRVTAGQPYFIQYICHEIVNIARHERKNFVTLRDVDRALQTTVEETTGIIRHAYMSLGTEERLLLSALSHITDDGRPFVALDDIIETLRQDDVILAKRDAYEHMRTLVERDFVTERSSEGSERQYGFSMELVRVWLERNDEYNRLLEEIRHD